MQVPERGERLAKWSLAPWERQAVLGDGIPMFPHGRRQIDLELLEHRPLQGGCVYVLYRVK